LLDLPQMMSEIVKDILDQAEDIAVVEASERGDADVVILAADRDDLPAVGRTQLERRATVRVITITRHGRTGYLYELRPHRTPLGEVSADNLLAAIRTRAADWA
jgi:hypothetical protein